MAAVAVTGLVTEATRNTASAGMGSDLSGKEPAPNPRGSTSTLFRATAMADPGTRFSAAHCSSRS